MSGSVGYLKLDAWSLESLSQIVCELVAERHEESESKAKLTKSVHSIVVEPIGSQSGLEELPPQAVSVEAESCDLLDTINSRSIVLLNTAHQSSYGLKEAVSGPSGQENLSEEFLTLKNVQYSRPPSREICSLAVATFEKMDMESLKLLKSVNDDLRASGRIGINELKSFTRKIMTDVWKCDDELTVLLRSDPQLTQTLGRELMVLFDNIMTDPVYEVTKTGKPQRYMKACLDNSIQAMYDDNIPENRWNTFETVISTYTSPTAFTPEMESLMRTATRLGISTNDLNLKKFVTERSLSAFLKTLIQAKLKKETVIKKFNRKLLGVLHHAPVSDEESGVINKFRYSFSKLYRYREPKINCKSSPEIRQIRHYTSRGDKISDRVHKRDKITGERIGDSSKTVKKIKFRKRRYEPEDTICNQCHEPYGEGFLRARGAVRSMSDSFLSLSNCESVTCCQCFSNAKKVWDKKQSLNARPVLISSHVRYPALSAEPSEGLRREKRSNLKAPTKSTKSLKTEFGKSEGCFGLLTEQRSFFRLGDGALSDALTDYIESKHKSSVDNPVKETTDKDVRMKKKRVHWLDEVSVGSSTRNEAKCTDSMAMDEHSVYQCYVNAEAVTEKIFRQLFEISTSKSREVVVADKPMKRVFIKALIQATLLAFTLWVCFVFYSRTPEIADRLRQLRFTTWLYALKRKPIS